MSKTLDPHSSRYLLWAWKHMKQRCYNPHNKRYTQYGGRGITVCPQWRLSSSRFIRDMGPSYVRGLSLERIDNDGPYSPENCRWATITEQARNKTSNVFVSIDGQTKCLEDWFTYYGISNGTFRSRCRRGWSIIDALSRPICKARRAKTFRTHGARRLTINGESHLISQWAMIYGIDRRTIYSRLRYGWTPEDAVTKRHVRGIVH